MASPVVIKLPPVTLPVAVTNPAVVTFPAIALPVTDSNPVTYSPVVANTATFDVPPIPMATLPPELSTLTLLVPFCMLVASMPVSWLPLPKK